jgi:hypothetical protein
MNGSRGRRVFNFELFDTFFTFPAFVPTVLERTISYGNDRSVVVKSQLPIRSEKTGNLTLYGHTEQSLQNLAFIWPECQAP